MPPHCAPRAAIGRGGPALGEGLSAPAGQNPQRRGWVQRRRSPGRRRSPDGRPRCPGITTEDRLVKRTLVVGVDGSPQSRAAADWAAREAVRRDLPLHVVHAWLWQPLAAPVVQDRDTEARRADDVLKEVESELAHRYRGPHRGSALRRARAGPAARRQASGDAAHRHARAGNHGRFPAGLVRPAGDRRRRVPRRLRTLRARQAGGLAGGGRGRPVAWRRTRRPRWSRHWSRGG